MRKIFLPLLFLYTVPALAQWQPVSNPVPVGTQLFNAQLDPVDAQAAWFVNSTLFVAPSSIQISRTVDGGQTWQNISPTAPTVGRYRLGMLEAVDAQHAWVIIEHTNATGATDALELHYTADGGTTWTLRPLPTLTVQLGLLRFFSLTAGILVDPATGMLHRTTDGGLTWQLQSAMPLLPAGQKLGVLREISGIIWTTVYNPSNSPVGFWVSTDRGLTWRTQSLPVISNATEVVFRDAQHALLPSRPNASGISGMLTSSDGGLTWQSAAVPPFHAARLTPVPGSRAYIAGAYQYLTGIATTGRGSAITYDDGQTWTLLENTNSYLTIRFTAPDAGWQILASIEPMVEDCRYEGIGRYVGSPLATRTARTHAVAADVFPNPSTGNFTLQLPATAGRVNAVRVCDALGRVVYHAASLPTDQRLDLSQQPRGVYSLEVQTSTGAVRQKLLLE